MVPLCMILFSSLLLFFHLLYNSLSLSLSFFLLLHYVVCLLASFQSPFLFLLCYSSLCLLSATLLQSSFCVSFLLSATLSCSMLPLSISSCFLQPFVLLCYYTFLLLCFYSFYAVSLQPAFFLLSSLICFLSFDLFFSNFSSTF